MTAGAASASRPPAGSGDERSADPILLSLGPFSDERSDTSTRLMLAAAKAFAAKGYHATTTRDIASGAGLSPAGVYVHYSSKEDLLFEISRRGHAAARDMLLAAKDAQPTSAAALGSAIGRFARWHAEHYEVGRIVQYEFQHLSPAHQDEVLRLRKEINEVVRSILRAGVADGSFVVGDVNATALALLSMAIDVARWFAPGIRRTPTEIEATYAALAVRLVAARCAADG